MTNNTPYVFVGGAQRSGTTMLQALLCQAAGANPMLAEASYLRGLVQAYRLGKASYAEETRDYFRSAGDLRAFHAQVVKSFLEHVKSNFSGCHVLVLKEPHLTACFPLLFELLPESRFVLIVRDPRDAIASMIAVGGRLRKRGERHFFQDRDMEKLSEYFRSFYLPVFTETNESFRKQVLVVKYEDLVSDVRAATAPLQKFLGLRFEGPSSGVLDLGRFQTRMELGNYEAWSTGKLGKWPESGSVGKYRECLSKEEIRVVESRCRPFLERFGYL